MGVTRAEEAEELIQVEEFKRGYVAYFQSILNLLGSFLSYITSGNISEHSKRDLLPVRKILDQELSKLQKRTRDVLFVLDERNLQPIARKEFGAYFPGMVMDNSRFEFVQFCLTYRNLRDYFLESTNAWNMLRATVLNANFVDQDFKNDQLLKGRIQPAQEKLKTLEVFLRRMGFLLKLENFQKLNDPRPFKPKFQEDKSYRLSSVFAEDFYAGFYEVESSPASAPPSPAFAPPPPFSPPLKPQEAPLSKPKENSVSDFRLDASGKFSWNSNPHYWIQYDPLKYNQERELFKSTINMDLHMGADEQMLRSELIRSMSSLEKKTINVLELEKDYLDFLLHFFEFCQNIVMLHIGIPTNLKWVFFFHVGPSHFYMIIRKFLTEAKTGSLHVRSSDGKKVTRFFPGEIVKKHVLDYWKNSLLINVGEEKNNLALLKKLVEIVEGKYKEATEHAQEMYKALPDSIKQEKPIDMIFRENMSHWMGAANIIIYKRFVKNQIEA